MDGDDGEVVNRKFLDEASIEVAAPRSDGIEAECSVLKHASGQGSGLGVAVAFCDGFA
jgi:hypothetical protein